MRFIHTADWHIGKSLNDHSLLERQREQCEQIINLIKETEAEALVIAGDVYDRANVSSSAMELVNNTFQRIIHDCRIPILLISGNHDSQQLIEYNATVLQHHHLYAKGLASKEIKTVCLNDTTFHLFPFVTPAQAEVIYDMKFEDYEAVIQHQIALTKWQNETANVAVYHGYVVSGKEEIQTDDSERPLTIGMAQCVSETIFSDFDYVCCGHLHRCHQVGSEKIQYSGSLYKYSKSEISYIPSVLEVDVSQSSLTVKKHALKPSVDVVVLKGYLEDFLKEKSDHYIYFELLDESHQPDVMKRLLEKYPRTVSLEYTHLVSSESSVIGSHQSEVMSVTELFELFYREVYDQDMTEYQRAIFEDALKEDEYEN